MMKKNGFVIVTAMVIASALTLMIGAYSITVLYQNQLCIRAINSVKAYYAADAGMAYALYATGYSPTTNTWNYSTQNVLSLSGTSTGDTVTLQYEPSNNVMTITAISKVSNVTRTIVSEQTAITYSSYPGQLSSQRYITKWNYK